MTTHTEYMVEIIMNGSFEPHMQFKSRIEAAEELRDIADSGNHGRIVPIPVYDRNPHR